MWSLWTASLLLPLPRQPFGLGQKITRGHTEGLGQLPNISQGRVLLAPLDPTDIGPIHTHLVREPLLGQSQFVSRSPDRRSKRV